MAIRGALTHHKTLHLAQLLQIMPPFALGLLEALWHATGAQTPNGAIGRMSNKAIAAVMFYTGDPDALVAALLEAGFLDEDKKYRLIIHNWHKQGRADDAVNSRLYRAVECFANGALPRPAKLTSKERKKLEPLWKAKLSSKPVHDHLFALQVEEEEHAGPQPAPNGSLPEPEPEPVPEPTTPLPPPVAGDSRRQRAARIDQERSTARGAALEAATAEVLRKCSVSGTAAVRMHTVVWFAIEAECARAGKPPEQYADDVGQLMAQNYLEYVRAGPLLEYRWNMRRFFEEGHWLNWQNWPFDAEKQRMQNHAAVGYRVM